MTCLDFLLDTPVKYNWTGKFEAIDEDWSHMYRFLIDFELIVMTEGTLFMKDNGDELVVEKGEYLLQTPFTHQVGYRNSKCSFYWLHISYNNPVQYIDISVDTYAPRENRIVLPKKGKLKNPEKVIVLMKQLQDSDRWYHDQLLNSYMSTMILCEIHNQLFLDKRGSKNVEQRQIFNDIVDYIRWYIHTDIKVSGIAEHFGYNEKYLTHLFGTMAGIPLKKYILQQKMEIAKYYLTDTNKTVAEIAYSLGFNDSHNFMKAFKKLVSLTPTEYRNTYSKRMLFYK